MKHPSTPMTVIAAALLLVGIAGVATASAPDHGPSPKKPHLKKGAVTSTHIKDGTIQSKDLSPAVRAAIAATPPPAPTPAPTPTPTPEPPAPAPAPYTPPRVYAAAPEGSVNVPFDTDTQVVSKTLPAGTYAIQADLTLYSIQSGIASCSLILDSDAYQIAQHTFPAGGGRTSVGLSSVIVVPAEKAVSVECWTPATGNASEIRLSAIQVTL